MILRSALPSIPEILRRLDIEPGRHRRARCPIHRGDNPTALSWTDEGQWFCHPCGIGGDAITLAQRALDIDCAGAMRWLGIIPGKPPAPDPAILRRRRIRAGLRTWAARQGRQLRDEYFTRLRVIARAERRLRADSDDCWGWTWLGWAYQGLDAIEAALDAIDIGTDQSRLEAYKARRATA